ncbi:MAG: conjugal transfer protein TraF [Legionellales bacterium]|nr:conjugal transfer protein TraF [Legionellales bacterium]
MGKLFLVLVMFLHGVIANVPFYDDYERGYYDHEVKLRPIARKKKRVINYTKIINSWNKRYKYLVNRAIVTADERHIAEFVQFHNFLILKAEKFSDVWQIVIAHKPSLNFATNKPISALGRQVTREYQDEAMDRTIKGLANTHGLVFFFSSGCKYCHAMSPVVKQFSKKYGWDVVPISLDGQGLEDFPSVIKDAGHAELFKVQGYPALMAYSETDGWIPLATGLQTEDQIKERIMLFKKYGKGGIR